MSPAPQATPIPTEAVWLRPPRCTGTVAWLAKFGILSLSAGRAVSRFGLGRSTKNWSGTAWRRAPRAVQARLAAAVVWVFAVVKQMKPSGIFVQAQQFWLQEARVARQGLS